MLLHHPLSSSWLSTKKMWGGVMSCSSLLTVRRFQPDGELWNPDISNAWWRIYFDLSRELLASVLFRLQLWSHIVYNIYIKEEENNGCVCCEFHNAAHPQPPIVSSSVGLQRPGNKEVNFTHFLIKVSLQTKQQRRTPTATKVRRVYECRADSLSQKLLVKASIPQSAGGVIGHMNEGQDIDFCLLYCPVFCT